MKIKSLQLKNFKRFTDLTLQDIPDNAKLVLLIGSNGSGKSSVFDAFEYINKGLKGRKKSERTEDSVYYSKKSGEPFEIKFFNNKSIDAFMFFCCIGLRHYKIGGCSAAIGNPVLRTITF